MPLQNLNGIRFANFPTFDVHQNLFPARCKMSFLCSCLAFLHCVKSSGLLMLQLLPSSLVVRARRQCPRSCLINHAKRLFPSAGVPVSSHCSANEEDAEEEWLGEESRSIPHFDRLLLHFFSRSCQRIILDSAPHAGAGKAERLVVLGV